MRSLALYNGNLIVINLNKKLYDIMPCDREFRGLKVTNNNYGQYYWCVKVIETLSPTKEIYVFGDKVEVNSNGDLIFWNISHGEASEENPIQNIAMAKGTWLAFFVASVIDGSAVAIEHWEGEVER